LHGPSRAVAALLLAAAALPGCIGLFVGSAVDQVGNAITYPVNEYVFLGAWRYGNDPTLPWRDLEDDRDRDFGEELIGIAVSGGGSRSACFLAGVLDEMRGVPHPTAKDGRSLLDEVDYISSVSGGSLSSTYYVLRRPADPAPAVQDAFFAEYQEDMRKNFESRSLGRMFLGFRWLPMLLTYYDRAWLIASTWDANFLDHKTFVDLPAPGNGRPSLLVNATSYSSGNAFIFSRVPSRRLRESLAVAGLAARAFQPGGTDPEFGVFHTSGFDTLRCDIGSYPLSLAVAASASVPGLLGPVIVRDGREGGRLESLGDGGLYDNYGLETLVSLFATLLEERPGLRARILVVDGSGYFPAFQEFSDPALGDYVDRMTSISWQRASGHSSLIFQLLRRGVVVEEEDAAGNVRKVARIGDVDDSPYRNLTFEFLSLYHRRTAADLAKERTEHGFVGDLVRAKPLTDAFSTFNSRVRAIGTRFSISSEDADLVRSQARAAVRDVLGGGDRSVAPASKPVPDAPR
jgi:predicted acylesterase/phospholipase RssA